MTPDQLRELIENPERLRDIGVSARTHIVQLTPLLLRLWLAARGVTDLIDTYDEDSLAREKRFDAALTALEQA